MLAVGGYGGAVGQYINPFLRLHPLAVDPMVQAGSHFRVVVDLVDAVLNGGLFPDARIGVLRGDDIRSG